MPLIRYLTLPASFEDESVVMPEATYLLGIIGITAVIGIVPVCAGEIVQIPFGSPGENGAANSTTIFEETRKFFQPLHWRTRLILLIIRSVVTEIAKASQNNPKPTKRVPI